MWTGIAVGIYALLIGVSGAILVFRPEMQAAAYPQFFQAPPADAPLADPATVLDALRASFPGYRFSGITYPTGRRGTFLAYLARGDELETVFADAASGQVIGALPRDGWIQQLQELHYNLLAGPPGFVVNGVGASALLLLCLTGSVIWWPGRGRLAAAVWVNARRGWRRVIRELHGAVGIWTVALLAMWALSGIYFSFPRPFRAAVARVMPMSQPPAVASGQPSASAPSPATLLRLARARVPGAQVARFDLPYGERGTYAVVLARGVHGDDDSSDEVTVYFDRYSAEVLAVDDGSRRTAGDSAMTWLGRLHFGHFGGVVIKAIWAAGGLALPALFVTGFIMWWNRIVRPAIPRVESGSRPIKASG